MEQTTLIIIIIIQHLFKRHISGHCGHSEAHYKHMINNIMIKMHAHYMALMCLAERGIFGELLRAVQSLYKCSQAAVRTREGETDWFEVKCGLRQGCVVSPLLFIIFMDSIMKRANQEENSIEELMFSDDLVLIAEDQSRLQEMVSNLDQ